MKHVWSDPSKAWNGFRRTKYYLNDRLLSLPLITASKETTTVGAFYKDFITDYNVRDLEVQETGLGGIEIARPGMDTLCLVGRSFSCTVLRLMIEFQKAGIQPFSTSWFWYDSDSAMAMPQEAYSFFVVFEDKIVRDRVVLFDDSDAGFDPYIFGDATKLSGSWSSDKPNDKAEIRFWYRKFYTETRAGQLMILRNDRAGGSFHVIDGMTVGTFVRKIYLLLWMLIIITVLMFLRSIHW
jgi:hypothetical protein